MPAIHWFRRDYRLRDNTALWHAARDAPDGVIPVFIFDDIILRSPDTGAPIVAFMLDCLRELDASLRSAGGLLILLHGDSSERLLALARATGASAVYFNRDYAPDGINREAAAIQRLENAGIAVKAYKDQVIFKQREILSASTAEPYTVYSFYRKAWMKRLRTLGPQGPKPWGAPRLRFGASLAKAKKMSLKKFPTVDSLGFELRCNIEIPVGESSAIKSLATFCKNPLKEYHRTRDFPAIDGTSRLSPHLRHGTLSPRQCLHAALEAKRKHPGFAQGAEAWIGELIWRDFFQQILFNFPEVARKPFRSAWATIRWPWDERIWSAWQTGQTGFPIIDAGMRQLNSTGWMHNRLRMIVANFLTRHLLVDYQAGELDFMQKLIDAETAQNNGNWQWSAGSGTDAQPYFRVFNPIEQARRYDPEGSFIRRFCPELAGVPTRYIHQPERMPGQLQHEAHCRIGREYPFPIVDHASARHRALMFLRKQLAAGRTEADD